MKRTAHNILQSMALEGRVVSDPRTSRSASLGFTFYPPLVGKGSEQKQYNFKL